MKGLRGTFVLHTLAFCRKLDITVIINFQLIIRYLATFKRFSGYIYLLYQQLQSTRYYATLYLERFEIILMKFMTYILKLQEFLAIQFKACTKCILYKISECEHADLENTYLKLGCRCD